MRHEMSKLNDRRSSPVCARRGSRSGCRRRGARRGNRRVTSHYAGPTERPKGSQKHRNRRGLAREREREGHRGIAAEARPESSLTATQATCARGMRRDSGLGSAHRFLLGRIGESAIERHGATHYGSRAAKRGISAQRRSVCVASSCGFRASLALGQGSCLCSKHHQSANSGHAPAQTEGAAATASPPLSSLRLKSKQRLTLLPPISGSALGAAARSGSSEAPLVR